MLPAVQSDATDVQASHPSVLSSQGRQLQLKCTSNLETDRAQIKQLVAIITALSLSIYPKLRMHLQQMARLAGSKFSKTGGHRYVNFNNCVSLCTKSCIVQKSGGGVGDNDYWGTKDLNTCCGKMNVKIPTDIPAGDYLLRAEALALHVAGSIGGAQFYMTCCMSYSFFMLQITPNHCLLRSNYGYWRRRSQPLVGYVPRRLQSNGSWDLY
jgi:hypothetical protein